MRLINASTLVMEEFFGASIPPYAILSHRWEAEEVTHREWMEQTASTKQKQGYLKITSACRRALEDGLDWLWVDTNCIDKTSSAELTEAINSMYKWYQKSEICYAFLSDVSPNNNSMGHEEFRNSRWFTRGWTLQELIAPEKLVFYSREWVRIGSRSETSILDIVCEVTAIERPFLTGHWQINVGSAAEKMSWVSKRETTREEDMAYCMLGIFEVNMPLLYGEGPRAFIRLQEEIIKYSSDHTLFCWSFNSSVPISWGSLLAPSPRAFEKSSDYVVPISDTVRAPYMMTNLGLSIQLPMIHSLSSSFLVLNAGRSLLARERACLAVRFDTFNVDSIRVVPALRRHQFPEEPINLYRPELESMTLHQVYVRTKPNHRMVDFALPSASARYGVMLLMEPTNHRLFDDGQPIGFKDPVNSGHEVHYIESPIIRTFPKDQFEHRKSVLNLPRMFRGLAASLIELGYRDKPSDGYILMFGVWKDYYSGNLKWYYDIATRASCMDVDPLDTSRCEEQWRLLLENFRDKLDLHSERPQAEARLPDDSLILKMGPMIKAEPGQELGVFYLLGPEQRAAYRYR